MKIRHIGISIGGTSKLAELAQALGHVQEMGYGIVELNPIAFGLIIDGQLRQAQLANFKAVLDDFELAYSVHGLLRLNLAYDPRHERCYQIMKSQIELCEVIGATHLVYHSGLQALDAVRYGVRQTLLSEQELALGAQKEIDACRRLAPIAERAGVTVCMENGDSHQWEHNLIAQFGRPRSELTKHHARLYIEPIVRQLEAINHPNFGMTLDVAHLHIAAHDMGFDYLDAVSTAAPWVKHLHLNDNFGRLDQGFDHEPDRWPFGEADIHLPPGWGSIPFAEVFARLPDYEGDMILEIKPGFIDYFKESLETMQTMLEEVEE